MDTPKPNQSANIDTNVSMEPIVYKADPISDERVKAFTKATATQHAAGAFPLTFATIFRKAEFMWLDRMKVDLRNLLHTDQEYDYVSPLKVGEVPEVSTKISHWKERRGMIFVTLDTDVTVAGQRRVLATTTFVVRQTKSEKGAGQ